MKRSFPQPFLFAVFAAFVALSAASLEPDATDETTAESPAYHLREGSTARSRIVALGRDMRIDGHALSHAVVLDGSMTLNGDVDGDVIVLAGDARLTGRAEVGGDVYVLGGVIDAAPGASIHGRSVAYPDASALWIALMEGPAMGLPAFSPVVIGAKLALLAFWAFLLTLVFAVGGRELLQTSESVREEPFRNFFVGLVGVSALTLTTLFASALAGAFLGVPLLALVAVVALLLRFWGMVAVFHALGETIFRGLERRPPLPVAAATYGLLVLGVLKFIPWLGVWTWSLATFIGVGATLMTKFGRREPWFEAA